MIRMVQATRGGHRLHRERVENLVQAMAAYQTALAPVIAANWQ